MNSPGKTRKAAKGERHRLDRDYASDDIIQEAPQLTPQQLGFVTSHTQEFIGALPDDLIRAHRNAHKLSERFGEEFCAQWCLKTPWLIALEQGAHDGSSQESQKRLIDPLDRMTSDELRLRVGKSNAARVRYALLWRPRYLGALALSRSNIIACKAAPVSAPTVLRHRKDDPDFAAQCDAAEEHAVQLLHDACFASALEGDCEPVYWQGIRVGHVRKFDSRLRIEMLRAYRPDRFKRDTYGASVHVTNNQQNIFASIGPEEQQTLINARRESLMRLKAAHDEDHQPLTPHMIEGDAPPPGDERPTHTAGEG